MAKQENLTKMNQEQRIFNLIAPIKALLRQGQNYDLLYLQLVSGSPIQVSLEILPEYLRDLFEQNPAFREIQVNNNWWVIKNGSKTQFTDQDPAEVTTILKERR